MQPPRVDESFWGGSWRLLPVTGSYVVDGLVLTGALLVIATVLLIFSVGGTSFADAVNGRPSPAKSSQRSSARSD